MNYRVFLRDELVKIGNHLQKTKSSQYYELNAVLSYWREDNDEFRWYKHLTTLSCYTLFHKSEVYFKMKVLQQNAL